MSASMKSCFVIMPFSKTSKHTRRHWTCHFEQFLKPLVEKNPNVRVQRSEAMRGDILLDIIKHLVLDPIVVADLTDWNPNVFWELGVRQSFHNPTITIAEKGTRLPFDLGRKGTLFYRPFKPKAEKFEDKLREAIKDCLDHPSTPDSSVFEAISGRGTFFEIFRRDEAKRRLDAVMIEMEANLIILESIEQIANENRKTLEYTILLDRLRSSAVELLATNRYLEESQEFYVRCELVLRSLGTLNARLYAWEQNPKQIGDWILNWFQINMKGLKKFRTDLAIARKRLHDQM